MAFKGLRFAGLEMKDIVSGKAMKLILAAIAIIPCLYGALYLAAFLDPYHSLGDVPVAVVNLDKGAEIDGDERNVGEEACDDLAGRTDGMQWHFVSADEAEDGMKSGEYYMTCTFPEDFSEMIASADTSTPEHAQMVVEYNQSSNIIASQIGSEMWAKIKDAINASVSEQYWKVALEKTDDAGDSLDQAAQGSQQLADGLGAVTQGADALTAGLSGMATGVTALQGGLDALATGGERLGAGVTALSANSSALRTGAHALADGMSMFDSIPADLPQKIQAMVDGVGALESGFGEVVGGIGNSETPGASLAYGSKQVTDGLLGLKASLGGIQESSVVPLKRGLGALSQDLSSLKSQVNSVQVPAGSDELSASLTNASQSATGVAGTIEGAQTNISSASQSIANAESEVRALVESGVLTQEQAQVVLDQLAAAQAQTGSAAGSLQDASASSANLASSLSGLSQNVPDTAALVQSMNSLSAGLDSAIGAIGTSSDGGQTLYGYANAISNGIAGAQAAIGDTSTPNTLAFASNGVTTGLDALGEGVSSLQEGLSGMTQSASGLTESLPGMMAGMRQLSTGADALATGVDAYTGGVDMISQRVPAFVQGTRAAASGMPALVQGASALAAGSGQLGAGLGAVAEGNQSLADSLAEGASEMKMSQTEINEKSSVMSDPVEIKDEYFTTVKNYGSGLAPYFIALGLWVGCLVASFAIRPLNTRLIAAGANPLTVAFSGFVPFAVFATIQAVLLMAVLQFGLGLQIDAVAAYYAFGILSAVVFAAIIQMLMAAFGFSGRFAAIILLMLQLTSSAGTFPIETAPLFFQVIHPLMPMTYVVEGMRQVMTGVGLGVTVQSAAALLAFGAVAFGITALIAHRKRMVRMETLHPLLNLPQS